MRDYKGFLEHLGEWDAIGLPYGTTELLRLSKIYNTPVPNTAEWFAEGFKKLLIFKKN